MMVSMDILVSFLIFEEIVSVFPQVSVMLAMCSLHTAFPVLKSDPSVPRESCDLCLCFHLFATLGLYICADRSSSDV